MSNYDDILRKKEEGYSPGIDLQGKHWEAMAHLLNPPPAPPATKPGMGKVINIAKLIFIAGGILVLGIWVYKQFSKSEKAFNGLLKPSNIQSQFFTIDNNKDEFIRTSHASVLKIKKGTFKTDKPVTIEIKEVFTPAEIVQSGLTTMAGDKSLRSAGMLYFSASAEGEKIEPSLPIDAFIPSKEKDPAMLIFKGEMQSDSTVNWTSPEPFADTIKPGNFEKLVADGKVLFQSKCASCHGIFRNLTGPALKNFQLRGPWKNPANIRAFINNPAIFMAKDQYTQNLKAQYGSMMTGFPDVNDTDITSLLAYINNVKEDEILLSAAPAISDTLSTATIGDSIITESANDCGSDTIYYSVQNYFEEYDTTGRAEILADTTNSISIENSEYNGIYRQGYDFEITNNGWYNIDAFLKTEQADDVKDVLLSAEIVNAESLPFNVYVFVPSERVFQRYTTKKGNNYNFLFAKDRIPLPLRYRALIFAFGSSGKKIMYGATEFTIQAEQHIKVELKETTAEGLLNLLNSKNINGVQIDAIEKEMQITPIPCNTDLLWDSPKSSTIGVPKK